MIDMPPVTVLYNFFVVHIAMNLFLRFILVHIGTEHLNGIDAAGS
jgi:hypothetical protein